MAALHEAPWLVSPASLPWVVSRRRSWSRVEHINVLELRVALDVLHLAGRNKRGSRVFVWMDSQVALGVVRKGRSSSAALNAVARHLVVAGLIPHRLPSHAWRLMCPVHRGQPSRWPLAGFG